MTNFPTCDNFHTSICLNSIPVHFIRLKYTARDIQRVRSRSTAGGKEKRKPKMNSRDEATTRRGEVKQM